MNTWNQTGKIKAILIAIFSLIPLKNIFRDRNIDFENYEFIGFGIFIFVFTILFLPICCKIVNLLGLTIKKANWNVNPISNEFLNNSLTFFQFLAYWFGISGILKITLLLFIYQKFDFGSTLFIFSGTGILLGIKLSEIWLKLKNK